MYIVVSEGQSYPWEVQVGDIDENGKKVTRKFSVRFKRLSQDEVESLWERLRGEKAKGSVSADENDEGDSTPIARMTDIEVIHEVVVGFVKGVLDADGNELPFNETNLSRLANSFPARPAIVKAFFDSIDKMLQKN